MHCPGERMADVTAMHRGVRKLSRVILVSASPEQVFAFLDDPRKVGAHMQGGGMGVKLRLETLSENFTGVGATHRWHGKAVGLKIDYTTVVEKWTMNKERASHTIGIPRMVIMSGFNMRWTLVPGNGGTRIEIDFEYSLPKSWVGRALGRLLGRRYGDWCLNMILADAVRALGGVPAATKAASSPRPA